MQFIYNLLTIILVVVAIPVFLYRSLREEGFVERLRQSFGFLPPDALVPVAGKDCIWLHAASVGEIVAASPIVKEIRKQLPERPILVSVVTASGYVMAKRIIKDADSIIFFPLDLPGLADRVIRHVRPAAFLPVETELWPNFLRAARKRKVPVMMVNGRISDKSVKRYRYMFSILEDMLDTVDMFCMQSIIDAQYVIRLGADPRRVVITGNTKFDQNYTDVDAAEKHRLWQEMGLTEGRRVIVGGSTHKGEEEALFAAFKTLRETMPDLALILAPREPTRMQEVVDLALQQGIRAARRTDLLKDRQIGHDLVLIDTIGELGKIYSLGDVVYVGGSLISHGGHNILEPAAHGKAIIVGPNMFNFKETYALFTENKACETVYDKEDLLRCLGELLQDTERRQGMEERTLQIIRRNQGAARKSAQYLQELLSKPERRIAGTLSLPTAMTGGQEKSGISRRVGIQTYLFQLIYGEKTGWVHDLLLLCLRSFSFLYGMGVYLKLLLYKHGVLTRHKLPCKVISLGNITVGGTGKTPTAQRLAGTIRDMGYRVVILNRGYRAKSKEPVALVSDGKKIYMTVTEAGDEAYLLAKNLPGVPVVIGKNRAVSGAYAVEKLKADVVILDDGYQHWQLDRDLDIVLIDTINVFGNNFLLPRGTLREPLENLNRAHAFLLTKVDQSSENIRDAIRLTLNCFNRKALVVESIHRPRCFIEVAEWYKGAGYAGCALDTVQGRQVMAVSAIGNPSSFEQTIIDLGAEVVDSVRFPDHHNYTMAEMQTVMEQAAARGVYCIITTEKDAVKFPAEFIHSVRPLPLYVLGIEVAFTDGDAALLDLIKQVMKQ